MNDLPTEMIFNILQHLPYSEMFRLQSICSLWRDFLDEIVIDMTWEDIENDLDLQIQEIPNVEGENHPVVELYKWCLVPDDDTSPTSLCRFFAMETIRISNEHEGDEMQKALESLQNRIGIKQFRLARELTHSFLDDTFKVYNEHYKTVNITMPRDLLALILAKRTSTSFHVEFTPRSYLKYANGVKSAQDFKMYRYLSEGEWKWEGLGDNWELMTARQILEQFTPTRVEGGQVTFKLLCLNGGSNTISHLFEAIIYLSEQIRIGHPIPWQLAPL